MSYVKRFILISSLLFFVLIQKFAFAAAIGASPGSIYFPNMLRNGYAETFVTVSNPSSEEIGVRIGAEGDIRNWLTYEPNTTRLGAGSYVRVKVIAKPPPYQPNGMYNGTIFVISEPPTATTGGATGSVAIAVIGLTAKIGITDVQVEDFKVESVSVSKTEECKKITIISWITNIGNVITKPKIHIDVLDQQETTTLKSYDQSDTEILPTTTGTIISRISPDLPQYKCIPPGLYKVKFKAYMGDNLKFENTYVLEIVPAGILSITGKLISLSSQKTATMGELVKVTGIFRDTGEVPVEAKLKTEIYLAGVLTQVSEGDILEALPGQDIELTAYFRPTLFGGHTIRGFVLFSGKTSDTQEISIDVSPNILIYVIIIVAIVAVTFYFIRRRRKKKRKR